MKKTMTRAQFCAWAVRCIEKQLLIPKGWWGTYDYVRGPGEIRVQRVWPGVWRILHRGEEVSRHGSRTFAITKALKLTTKEKRP